MGKITVILVPGTLDCEWIVVGCLCGADDGLYVLHASMRYGVQTKILVESDNRWDLSSKLTFDTSIRQDGKV